MTNLQRIAIVGAGHVGATAAYALMLRALVHEIVLIDENVPLAEAEAADLSDANALARPARIWAGDYGDAATAQIAVLTAGAATHGDESRLAVAARSAAIVTKCVDALVAAGFSGILLIAANPVDLMTLVALQASRMPPGRVFGTGTLLDSARLRQSLAMSLNVSANSIEGLVLGEHGDSEVAALSSVRIGGVPLADFDRHAVHLDFDALATEVREAGYRIIEGKGYTSFGIATAIVRICEAIVRDEQSVLPVSVFVPGKSDAPDAYFSLPCVIGAKGVERTLSLDLPPAEQSALDVSANALRSAMATLSIDEAS